MAQTIFSEISLTRKSVNIDTALQGCLFADVVLGGFLHSMWVNKMQHSPTVTFQNSFSLLTPTTKNIMCKVPSDYTQTCHLWFSKCPSHLSHDTGIVFWKNVTICFAVFLDICFGTVRDWARHALGCSAHKSSAELHKNRIQICLFFGPLYKTILKRG